MEIYKKLQSARKYIRTCKEEKKGHNQYSGYKYFTPEQISQLVSQACENNGLLTLFNLKRNENGYLGELQIVNIETPRETLKFEMATDIPLIKATNATQQIGGAVTYTERYLSMVAFDIKDNNLDFDSQDNRPKPEQKPKLKELLPSDKSNWEKVKKALIDGYTIDQIKTKWVLSEENQELLLSETI